MNVRLVVAAGLITGGVTVGAPPALADPVSINDVLSTCDNDFFDPFIVVISADVVEDTDVTVACNAVIDLSGYTVDVNSIAIAPGKTLIIEDSLPPSTGHLIADGQTAGAGIAVPATATLEIRGGNVTALGAHSAAGIGGGDTQAVGTIIIAGGTVAASSVNWGAGIGGGAESAGGSITISGGTVTAIGANRGAGIGGGVSGDGGTITITGGTVTATGGDWAAGIGGGGGGRGGTITISDSTVVATGGTNYGAGIGGGANDGLTPGSGEGGTITITDSTVTAAAGHLGAGIGGGSGAAGGTIAITRSTATATGGIGGAGVGSGNAGGGGGSITVTDSTLTATGGSEAAGIGGGHAGTGGIVTITNSTVTATGGLFAAGIGGGSDGAGGTVTLDASTVTAVGGGSSGAGIGGGLNGPGGTVTILSGDVTATGGTGIGGGSQGAGGTTTIHGGHVTATGSNGAGIGGGQFANGGITTIHDGTVTATGSPGGAGIGGGESGRAGTTTINGGDVIAQGGHLATGIGAGSNALGATITITGGTVAAHGVGAPGIGSSSCLFPAADPADRILIGAAATVTATFAPYTLCPNWPAIDARGTAPALVVAGELRLSAPLPVAVPDRGGPPHVLVEEGGLITGPLATPSGGSGFAGDGFIENHGVIAFTETLVDVDVTDHNYLLTFEPSVGPAVPIRVFAPTFAAGYRTAPTPTAGTAWVVEGESHWWSPDDTLTGDLTLVELDLQSAVSAVAPAAAVAGDTVTISASASDRFGPIDPQPALEYTSSNATDVVAGNAITVTEAGTRTITVRWPETGATDSVELDVVAGPASELELAASAASVPQGGSVTFTVTGEDEFGNPADTTGVVLTSSVATDVIDGLTVSFPTASPHVITATLGTLSASVTIEVVPPPATTTTTTTTTIPATTTTAATTTSTPVIVPVLPATGSSSTPLVLAAVLLLAGTAFTVAAARRHG